jgi:hypothetical protein
MLNEREDLTRWHNVLHSTAIMYSKQQGVWRFLGGIILFNTGREA